MATIMRKQFNLPNSIANEEINVVKNFRSMLGALVGKNTTVAVFASICMGLRILEDDKIGTMAVTVRNGSYVLMYSPKMVAELSVYDCGIVLSHEMAHLSLSHTARQLRILESTPDALTKRKYSAILGIAADLAVNSWLIDKLRLFTKDDLSKIGNGKYPGIHPDHYSLEDGKSMEWYIEAIVDKVSQLTEDEKKKFSEGSCESGGAGDTDQDSSGQSSQESKSSSGGNQKDLQDLVSSKELSGQGSSSSKLKDIPVELLEKLAGDYNASKSISEDSVPEGRTADEVYQDLVGEAGDSLAEAIKNSRQRGLDPGNYISSLWKEMYAPPQVNWRDVLRRYCTSSRPVDKVRTIVKPKRNAAYLGGMAKVSEYPGKKKEPMYSIMFAIDTSGSVSNSDIEKIFSELDGILKDKTIKITVVECDARIHRIYSLGAGEKTKVDRKVYGRGGTSFDPVFKLAKQGENEGFKLDEDIDLLIYATDGECHFPSTENRINPNKVIWLSTTGSIPADKSWGVKADGVNGKTEYGRYIVIS